MTTTPVHHPTTWEEFIALAEQHPDAVCVVAREGVDYVTRAHRITYSNFKRYAPWTVVLPPPPPPDPLPEWAADDVCMVDDDTDGCSWSRLPGCRWYAGRSGSQSGLTTVDLVAHLRGHEVTVIGRFVNSEAGR